LSFKLHVFPPFKGFLNIISEINGILAGFLAYFSFRIKRKEESSNSIIFNNNIPKFTIE